MADDDEETDEEVEAHKALLGQSQAIYVDTIYTLWWRGHLRISLGEKLGDKTHWRTTVLVEAADAEQFAASINKVLAKLRQREQDEIGEGAEGEEKSS